MRIYSVFTNIANVLRKSQKGDNMFERVPTSWNTTEKFLFLDMRNMFLESWAYSGPIPAPNGMEPKCSETLSITEMEPQDLLRVIGLTPTKLVKPWQ